MSDKQDYGRAPYPYIKVIPYAEESIDQAHWNYRVAKEQDEFSIRLVEYNADHTIAHIHFPEDSYPLKNTPEDFAKDIRRYINALNHPVLEVP